MSFPFSNGVSAHERLDAGTPSGITAFTMPPVTTRLAHPGEPESGAPLSLREMVGIVRRRAAIIGYSFVLIMIPGIAFTLLQPPTFRSTAKLVLENTAPTVSAVDASNPLSALFAMSGQKEITTEVQVLQSTPLRKIVQSKIGNQSFDLRMARIDQSNVIEITAEANSPKLTQSIPTLLIRSYLERDKESSLKELNQAGQFIDEEMKAAQRKLEKSEDDLRDFKQLKDVIVSAEDRDSRTAHLAELRGRQETLQATLNAAESELTFLRGKKTQEPTVSVTQLPAVSSARQAISQEIRRLHLEETRLAQELAPTNSKLIEIRSNIASLRVQLATTPALESVPTSRVNAVREDINQRIVEAGSKIAMARADLQTVTAQRTVAEEDLARYPMHEFKLERLNRDHDAAKQTIQLLTNKRVDIALREKAYRPSARLLEPPDFPLAPVKPRRAQNIVVLTVFGLMVGFGFALLLEYLDDRINSIEEGNRILGLPTLGSVPKLSTGDFKLLSAKNGFRTAESYRILRTNIHFAAVDHPAQTLLITSADPGEGKTTTALNLAQAFAIDNRRVILVDTDLRRPSLHQRINEEQAPGLTDVLVGTATVTEVLRTQKDVPGLQVITAGSVPPNPSELLGSQRFRSLLDELHKQADMVILDSAPLLVAADSSILSAIADGVVLVLESGKTRKGSVRRAIDHLRHARAHILGIVYNKVTHSDIADYYYTPYYGTTTEDAAATVSSRMIENAFSSADALRFDPTVIAKTFGKNGHSRNEAHSGRTKITSDETDD